jgi:hypothetical protein
MFKERNAAFLQRIWRTKRLHRETTPKSTSNVGVFTITSLFGLVHHLLFQKQKTYEKNKKMKRGLFSYYGKMAGKRLLSWKGSAEPDCVCIQSNGQIDKHTNGLTWVRESAPLWLMAEMYQVYDKSLTLCIFKYNEQWKSVRLLSVRLASGYNFPWMSYGPRAGQVQW